MPYRKELLLIFIKNPVKGEVKTRLAQTVGDDKALAVYKELLKITKSVSRTLTINKQVWYSSFIEEDDLWREDSYTKHLQQGTNLGQRMKNAFQQSFATDFKKVVIIGSDCAELRTSILQQAFKLLDKHEVVIGPSLDGGYYLLGMSNYYPTLFEQKKWGSPSVFEETIRQLQKMNISYQLLPVLNDIDTEEDLKKAEHPL